MNVWIPAAALNFAKMKKVASSVVVPLVILKIHGTRHVVKLQKVTRACCSPVDMISER